MISAIFAFLLEAALRGLLAAAAVWAGLRVLRIGNVVAQKAAWGLVLVAALAMPLAPRWQGRPIFAALRLPTLHWDQTPVAEAAGPRAVTPASAQVVAEPAAQIFQSPAISSEEFTAHARSAPEAAMDRSASVAVPQPEAAKAGPAPPRVAEIAWVLYLGVFAALLLRLLFGLAAALRLWMTAKPVAALDDSDGADWIGLRFSARVGSPVNIGSGIVLPADYAEWGEEKLRVVLAHERSHIRQGDFYLQLLAGLYASLFWFSPLGWWLKRKLCELGEAISDRAEEIEKARKVAHGHFLWFRHDGKSYVVDDPAIVSQLEAMNKSTDELHEHMQAIGDQMRALGEQQRDLGKQMRDISVPTPRPLQRNGRVECSRRQPEGQAGRHHQSKRARRTAARIRQNPGRARRAARQDRRPARRSWRQYGKVRRSDG